MTSRPARGATDRQDPVAERLVREAFGGDEEAVDGVGLELGDDLVPDLLVVAVDGRGAQAAALGRLDLVAHEAEQGRDEQRRAGAPGPEQRGGDEVDGALAPAGALHDEHAATVGDEGGDGFELPVPELGGGIADELAQGIGCFGGEVGLGHGHRPYRAAGTVTFRP